MSESKQPVEFVSEIADLAQDGGLSGRAVLVTGATGGIGRASAEALARAGARVGVAARDRDRLDALANQLGAWSLPCDVTDHASIEALRSEFEKLAGGVPDVLVVSAGVFSLRRIEQTSPRDFERNLAVNLTGSFLTVRAFLPGMVDRGSGTIIQVGSVAGRKGFVANGAYAASKYGLRGFHDVLLEELRGTGVRATLLEPAATDTSLWDGVHEAAPFDLPDRAAMLRPESVAACVAFIAAQPPKVQVPYLALEAI